jgi:transcriptional regulator with XRE-family HTH domain
MGNSQSLKDLRKSAGLTQKEVAKALGYERESISRIESGVWPFPVSKWREVAALYKCSVKTVALAVAKTMEEE